MSLVYHRFPQREWPSQEEPAPISLAKSVTSHGTNKPPRRFLNEVRAWRSVRGMGQQKPRVPSQGTLHWKESSMTLGRIARIAFFTSMAVLASVFLANSESRPAAKAQPQSGSGGTCVHVGGSIITNFGGVDANTTLGPAT